MAKVEVVMPKMGESIIEATVLKWLKNVGDKVALDEPIMEIATDKVDSEVPSPVEGILTERSFKEGDVVPVGKVIAVLDTAAVSGAVSAPSPEPMKEAASSNGKHTAAVLETVKTNQSQILVPVAQFSKGEGSRFYSPLVLNIARQEGVSMGELEVISGSGTGGRVTKKDILGYVTGPRVQPETQNKTVEPQTQKPAANFVQAPAGGMLQVPAKTFTHSGNFDIIEMDRMRKMIAENMVYSKHVSAHVTSFVEADMTNVVMWRNRVKDQFEKKYGEKLTFTPIFIEAVVKALREMPMVNVSVDGTNILVKKDINIGVAVALPNDNLIVPVIKNADRMNLFGLSAALNDLAARARINKLKMDELEGGTYTLSNVGTFGNVMGTPVIMQPQCAILATGAIRKKPAVIETPSGDFIGIRHLMFLSHSYDHRVIDGALGGRFVKRVADILENFDLEREI